MHAALCFVPPLGSTLACLGLMALTLSLGANFSCAAEKAAETKPPSKPAETPEAGTNWKSLFDGKTLTGWRSSDFSGRGEVTVKDGQIRLGEGYMTGITWTNVADLPRMDYEISLEAMRVEGSDFFCGLTFPVGKDPCSFIVGGWGGGVVGLSSLDGQDASQNETTKYMNFENGKWFKVRLKVTKGKIEAWIDADKMVDVTTEGKSLSIRLEVEPSKPLGIATWNTAAALRNIRLRRL
ncbi:MAG TPA: DUF1080 domain-containing protein [Candidatus Saccharimonadales bacterium]|nr:DUF1080 domain-containing protein [Candidatus Saccharimonadales bacterium]